MAKEFENSVADLAPDEKAIAVPTAFGGALALTMIGSFMTAAAENWPIAALFVLAFVAVAVAWFLSWRAGRNGVASKERTKLAWHTAMPEIQRQDLNIEVIQLSKVLDVSSDQIADLQSAYIVAEDLALRQIQQEEAALLLRHVTIGNVPFTAVLVKDDYVACIEASFVVSPELRQDRVEAIIRKIAAVKAVVQKEGLKLDVRLMLVLITQLTSEDEDKLRRVVKKRFADTPVTIDIRFLDFESLQRIYVTD